MMSRPSGGGISSAASCAGLLAIVVALWPARAMTDPLAVAVVQDRLYRVGVYLVVDALVQNQSPRRVDGAEVSVEFYNFFDELLSAESTVLRPWSLGPGQVATLRVVTPWSDDVRKLRYRFTWRQDGEQLQDVSKRDVWTIGKATRDP